MENDRRGNFHRVFPSPDFTATYKNFFEEERYNDILLFDYIFTSGYFFANSFKASMCMLARCDDG